MNQMTGIFTHDANGLAQHTNHTYDESRLWEPDNQSAATSNGYTISCTQRYIKPTDHLGPLPYEDTSGCVFSADCFLTNTSTLRSKLGIKETLSDITLIAMAYEKWGQSFLRHLDGCFCIAIYDKKHHRLLLATDHKSQYTCFYKITENKEICFSNTMGIFQKRYKNLKINDEFFLEFALDCSNPEETCLEGVKKIPQGHYLIATDKGVKLKRYWKIEDEKELLAFKTREEYLEAFKELFTDSVSDCLESNYAIQSQLSGGLDSSSVTAIAAQLLTQKNKTLQAITALPTAIDKESYRAGWKNSELELVKQLLTENQNIQHQCFHSQPDENIFEMLSPLYPHIDTPIRNVFNSQWVVGTLKAAQKNGCRIMLTGAKGNFTISWPGLSFSDSLRYKKNWLKRFIRTPAPNILNKEQNMQKIKNIVRKNMGSLRQNIKVLQMQVPQHSNARPIELYTGVSRLDPTYTKKVLAFRYNTPQYVYRKGNDITERRLLVREGLTGIVPSSILKNRFRGEQSSDWHIQYNSHIDTWRRQIENSSPKTLRAMWEIYDKNEITSIIDQNMYIHAPNGKTVKSIRCQLIRFISACQFYEHLLSH